MNLKIRRVLYITFILVFLILAPLVIFYAIGYRYDLKTKTLEKIGLLILETKPLKSNVYINGKLYTTKTPLQGQSLRPGIYNIKITKPGYYSWEKNLEIKSELTTFVQDVVLFKKTPPVKIIDGDFTDFTLSPDQKNIITLWQNSNNAELWYYNLNNTNQEKLLVRTSLTDSELQIKEWSNNGKNLLINNYSTSNNNYFVIKLKSNFWQETTPEIIYLKNLIKDPITNAKWDNFEDDILYITTDNALWRLDLNSTTNKEVAKTEAEDFIVYNKILYFDKKLFCLAEIEKNPLFSQTITEQNCYYRLATDSNYQLIPSISGLITVRNLNNNELTLINLNTKSKIFQAAAKQVKWNFNNNKMLYYDDFAVGTFSPAHDNPYRNEMIGRYSQEIKNIIWYPVSNHLIVMLNNEIKLMELDMRDKRNVIDFKGFSNLKNMFIDQEGKNLYAAGQKDNETGIWQINIF